ncbi:hypothetical protein E2I00_013630, partial [Balaenoptera physalus]
MYGLHNHMTFLNLDIMLTTMDKNEMKKGSNFKVGSSIVNDFSKNHRQQQLKFPKALRFLECPVYLVLQIWYHILDFTQAAKESRLPQQTPRFNPIIVTSAQNIPADHNAPTYLHIDGILPSVIRVWTLCPASNPTIQQPGQQGHQNSHLCPSAHHLVYNHEEFIHLPDFTRNQPTIYIAASPPNTNEAIHEEDEQVMQNQPTRLISTKCGPSAGSKNMSEQVITDSTLICCNTSKYQIMGNSSTTSPQAVVSQPNTKYPFKVAVSDLKFYQLVSSIFELSELSNLLNLPDCCIQTECIRQLIGQIFTHEARQIEAWKL